MYKDEKPDTEDERIHRLEEQASELEAQLAAVRSQLSVLYSMQPGTTQPTQGDGGLPGIMLQPLRPYDRLRTKWGLGTGLDIPQHPAEPPLPPASGGRTSYLRLFGLLSNGSPWESRIPFSAIARSGGVRLGRDSAHAEITLADASISRCHLLIELREEGLVVTDCNSTNGTAVNGQRLASYQQRVPLQNSDTLTLGDIMLQAEIVQPQH